MRLCQLFGIILYLSIVDSVVAIHVHGNVGAVHGCIDTIATAEYSKVRMVAVVVCILPFCCFQESEWGHTFQDGKGSLSCYVAGLVTATIDIMRADELPVIEELVRVVLPVDPVCSVPFLVPDHIDGEVVLFLSVFSFCLCALVLSQFYKGITFYVGIGIEVCVKQFAVVVRNQALSSAIDFSCEVGCIYINMCISLYLCSVSTAIDVAIDGWCLCRGAVEVEVGASKYLSYEFWMLGIVIDLCIAFQSFLPSVTAGKHIPSDVGIVADGYVGALLYYSHVATAIDILKEGSTINLNRRLSINACHVVECVDIRAVEQLGISHTISTTEYRAVEGTAINGQLNIAIYLTEVSIISSSTTLWVFRIVIISSTSTSEDTFTAIEFAAIDDKRGYGFACLSVYVSTILTWFSICSPKVRTHISATATIDTVDLSFFRTKDTSFYDNLVIGQSWIYLGICMCVSIVAFIHAKISFGSIIVAESHDRFRAAVCPVRDAVVCCMISIISDTIHTTCSCTIDTAEDFFWFTFRRNCEGSTLDGDGAIAVEWVFYQLTTLKTTSCTTTVNLGDFYTAIDIRILIVTF